MKKSTSTKKTEETKAKYHCEFCEKDFVFEKVFVKHLCTLKHRWQEKDHRGNQIGFDSWVQFYSTQSMSSGKKYTTYQEFIKSPYYTAFARFGSYCFDIKCVNVPRYVSYLLKEKVKLSDWNSDLNYNKFLIEYMKYEDPMDAVRRTVEHCLDLSEAENIQVNDTFRYCNQNRLLHSITTGRISPWVLYQSDSGVKLLDELNEAQVRLVYDYINPQQWAIKFNKDPEKVAEVKSLLKELRW